MTNEPTIIRVASRKDNPYFLMARASAQDTRLSLAAMGLLTYLLSKPDDWIISITHLQTEWHIGRDKVYKLIDELKQHGYITGRGKHKVGNTWIWEPYYIHETPQHSASQSRSSDFLKTRKSGNTTYYRGSENEKIASVDCEDGEEYKSW